jgi:hypothetical protein
LGVFVHAVPFHEAVLHWSPSHLHTHEPQAHPVLEHFFVARAHPDFAQGTSSPGSHTGSQAA